MADTRRLAAALAPFHEASKHLQATQARLSALLAAVTDEAAARTGNLERLPAAARFNPFSAATPFNPFAVLPKVVDAANGAEAGAKAAGRRAQQRRAPGCALRVRLRSAGAGVGSGAQEQRRDQGVQRIGGGLQVRAGVGSARRGLRVRGRAGVRARGGVALQQAADEFADRGPAGGSLGGVDHCRSAEAGCTRERFAGRGARDRGGALQYDVDEFADRLRAGRSLARAGRCGSAGSSRTCERTAGLRGPGGRGVALQYSVDEFADRARAG